MEILRNNPHTGSKILLGKREEREKPRR